MSDKKLLLHNHRGYRWKLNPQPTVALIKACLFSLVKFSYTLGGGVRCFAGCRAELGHSWSIHQIEYYSVSTTNMGNPLNTDKWVLGACGIGSLMYQYCFLSNLNSQSSIHVNSLSLSSFHSFSFSFLIQLISTHEK